MVGILVLGSNHFILSGPRPDEAAAAHALLRHGSRIQIGIAGGKRKWSRHEKWEIRTKEFRENLR